MKKMYRVFVSSTYEDLKEERIAVINSLLQMDCMPVCMEKFDAADVSSMQYIKAKIDTCDFYVLIVAGRYGSMVPHEHISYTEKEYDYAVAQQIPILAFIYNDIKSLPQYKIDANKQTKLDKFIRKICDTKQAARWNNIQELTDKIQTSLMEAFAKYPHVGYEFNNRLDISIPLTNKLEDSDVADRIMQSHNTYIFGLACTHVIGILEEKYRNDKTIKFPEMKILLMQPTGNAVKLARYRAGWADDEESDFYAKPTQKIKKLIAVDNNILLKHIDYLAPYNMYIFDPDDNKKAEIIVHIAGWRVSNQNGRPALHLYKSNNSTWFGYFLDQFNKMWKFAEEKNGEKENDNTNNYK